MELATREPQPQDGKHLAQGEVAPQDRAAQLAKLDALGQSLAEKRSEAINARQACGIEDIWQEDEEYYEGIDEKNRGTDGKGTWRQKPPGKTAGRSSDSTQSTVFPNVTGPFTDAAAARIADMLMPTDERAWKIKPTPIPALIDMQQGRLPKDFPAIAQQAPLQQGMEAAPPPDSAQMMAGGEPAQAPPTQQPPQLSPQEEAILAAKQAAEEEMEEALRKAKLATQQIDDWQVDCQFHAQIRQVIEDAARIGVGVLKGPVPFFKKRVAYINGQMEVLEEIIPRSKWVDPWNFFPDPACGENIHNGSFTWERDYLSIRQLMELADDPNYIGQQIKAVIEEGALQAIAEFRNEPLGGLTSKETQKNKFEVWYYYGLIDRDDLESAGCDCSDMDATDRVPACITMVNNRVIKAALNPLDTGEFPYDTMVWRRRSGHWTGIGVSRQIRTPQKMIVGATRHLMDNAGIAAGPMLVFKQGAIAPADGKMGFKPRKIFYLAEDSETIDDVRKAIGTIKVDMVIDELLKLIELAMRFAEDTTGLPMLIQGQMGAAPDTVGGMTMLNNNATSVLRRLARTFDDRVTSPHQRRYYTWLLQYGENDDAKGDFTIVAQASSALVERDLQSQEIAQMAQIVTDLRFGADPKKWFREFLISRHFDPKQFEFDDREWEQMLQKLSQPPPDPRLEAAKLNAESRERMGQLNAEIVALKEKMAQETKQIEMQWQSQENALDRERDIIVEQIEQQNEQIINQMREQGMDKRTLEQLKVSLAETSLKLKTQKDLNAGEVIKPAAEPKGRASPGKSFTQ